MNDQIYETEMVETYGTYVGRQKYSGFWWGSLKGIDHLEDLGIHFNTIFRQLTQLGEWA